MHPRASSFFDERVTYHDHNVVAAEIRPVFTEAKPHLVISTVRGGSFDIQKEIIDCAVECGVPRFMPSEFGQDSLNEKVQKRLPPSRERARIVEYLRELSQDGKISWAAVATGVDLDRGLLNGTLGFNLKWESATLHGRGYEKFAASSSGWIGQAVVAIVDKWEQVENQYLYAAGTVTSADDIIAVIERAVGKTFEVGRGEVDECVREAAKRIDQGYPDAGMFLYGRSVLYDQTLNATRPFKSDDAKNNLGLESQKLEDLIDSVLHQHRHHGGGIDCGCN